MSTAKISFEISPVDDRLGKYESIVYASLWVLILLLPFFNEILKVTSGMGFSWCKILKWWLSLVPYLAVFAVNNYLLVPRFFLRKKYSLYTFLAILFFCVFLAVQWLTFDFRIEALLHIQEYLGESEVRMLRLNNRFLGLPMPLVLNLAVVLLLVTLNTLIIVVFRYLREKENRERLEMMHLKDELKFLKAQINPHFFMNMLNNIHAMIELDSEKAQDMTLELSKLMRYVLYDGESMTVSFADEIGFVSSYVSLMRRRYPESKVEINLEIPENPSKDIIISPLLFVTFVENAFKHGISYQKKSRIYIFFDEVDGKVRFLCRNTRPSEGRPSENKGVGLENARRRLSLLYGEDYELRIDDGKEYYEVELLIPSL